MNYQEKEKRVWTGTHNGVGFEINNWKSKDIMNDGDKDNWTYYIFLHLDRIPKESKPNSFWLKPQRFTISDRVHYDYNKHPVIDGIDFHGGCTWYSKEHGFDKTPKVIKIGCDYMHLFDENHFYYIESIVAEVKNTIERFRELVPDYRYWCQGNGGLYPLKDGEIKGEVFISNDWKKKQPKN